MIKHILFAALLATAIYGLHEAWALLSGPSLSLVSPIDQASFPDGIVHIQGEAKRAAHLTMNGMSVLRDENGAFSMTLSFPRGGSILTFVATDRFGRRRTETRSIFVL